MGKIFAISSTGKTEKSFLDLRFGKCDNIVIYDADKNNYSIFENPYKDNDFSGIKLVNRLKEEGVTTIITGEIGPRVVEVLEKDNLQLVLLSEERIKIEDIIKRINP